MDQSKEDISDCKGLRDVAMATKVWPKITKLAKTSVVCNVSMQFGFEIFFVLLGNSSVTLPCTRNKGATNFGTKIAINAYK